MAGAQPTLTGITQQASRGGLFDQSNVANPISGADVQGTVINDSTITLSITINGDTQTDTFTTNQAMDETLPFNFTIANTGGGVATTDGVVDRGSFDPATGILTLNRTNELPDVTITGFVFTPRTDQEINDLADARITANTTIVRSVNGQAPVDNTGAITIATGTVGLDNFESSNTVVFRAGTADANDISADARVRMQGNSGRGDNVMAAGVNATEIILDASTGLVLDNTGDVVTIRAADAAPAEASTPTTVVPDPSSALDPVTVPTRIAINPQGTDTVTAIAPVDPSTPLVTAPDGTAVTGVTTDVTAGTGAIIIPARETNAPGNYMITSSVTTMSVDGETRTTTESDTLERFIPFFQSRSIPTNTSPGTISMERWPMSGSFNVVLPGTGLLYLAVADGLIADGVIFADQSGFPIRVSRPTPNTFTLNLADGTPQVFDIFRFPAGDGQTISNFRTTR